MLKLAASLVLLALESPGGLGEALRRSVALLRETPLETAQFAVPALAYTLQNNLWYYALTNLDPVTAAVTSQLKVITTAVASTTSLSEWSLSAFRSRGRLALLDLLGCARPRACAWRSAARGGLSGVRPCGSCMGAGVLRGDAALYQISAPV